MISFSRSGVNLRSDTSFGVLLLLLLIHQLQKIKLVIVVWMKRLVEGSLRC